MKQQNYSTGVAVENDLADKIPNIIDAGKSLAELPEMNV